MNKKKTSLASKIMLRIQISGLIILMTLTIASVVTLFYITSDEAIDQSMNLDLQIMKQMDNLLKRTSDVASNVNVDNVLETLIYKYRTTTPQSEQRIILENQISLQLKILYARNSNAVGIMLITNNEEKFCSNVNENEYELFNSKWLGEYYDKGRIASFSHPFKLKNSKLGENDVVAYCSPFMSVNGIKGDVVILTLFKPLKDILKDAYGSSDTFIIMDKDNVAFYPQEYLNMENIDIDKILSLKESAYVHQQNLLKTKNGYNFVITSIVSGWKLVTSKSYITLLKPYIPLFLLIVCSLILFYLVTQSIMMPLLKNIIKPLKILSKAMKSTQNGNLHVIPRIETGDELEVLCDSFNFMNRELQNYIESTVENEKTQNLLKYSLLISQVDPHFIYNTMNTITYLARKGCCDDIVIVNRALMTILRDRLRINGVEIYDTVEREIDVVTQYCVIQRYRYGDNFELIWDVEEYLYDREIPKNIIQPIVENALIHGIMSNKNDDGSIKKGLIKINIFQMAVNLVIQINNNGTIMSKESVEKMNSWDDMGIKEERGEHIGVSNIKERLYCIYKSKECLRVESNSEEGTTFTIYLNEQKSNNSLN